MEELARITPVSPPIVNKNTKPTDHNMGVSIDRLELFIVANQLKTFTPVGIAITMVAEVK
jgi:hypothetical protein